MAINCPKCKQPIPEGDFNISTDLAYCRHCHLEHRYSSLTAMDDIDEVGYKRFVQRFASSRGFERRATIPFSRGILLFLVPFTCFWSGLSMWGIYIQPIIENKLEIGQAMFGIPFLVGTIALVTGIFLVALGKSVVEIEDRTLRYRIGAGPFCRRKEIPLDASTTVSLTRSDMTVNDRAVDHIEVCTSGETITFGATIKKDRKKFLYFWIICNLPGGDRR